MFTRSLNSILAGFNKTITALSDLIQANEATRQANHEEIATLETTNTELIYEFDRAVAVKASLVKLIQGGD